MLGMLDERQPRRVTYDAPADALDLDLTGDGAKGDARSVAADLLLDAKGFVVGVDLRDAAHIVVMIGPHEAVATQVPARVEITPADAGSATAEIGRVRILKAKSQVRGHEKSPYV